MASYLKETVLNLAKSKGITLDSYADRKVREADSDLDRKKIDLKKAMDQVKSAIGGNFSGSDYSAVERAVSYKVK